MLKLLLQVHNTILSHNNLHRLFCSLLLSPLKIYLFLHQKHPESFFALARELYPGQFKPTACHYFIKLLKVKGLLKCCYSQNIHTLESVAAGLEGEDLIETHGTFYTSVRFMCWKEDLDWMKEKIFSDDIPKCDKCSNLVKGKRGYLVSYIVFFGENLPKRFFTSMAMDFPRCDFLIIMGTSLQVQLYAALVGSVSNSCPRLLINLEQAGSADPVLGMIGIVGGMDFDSEKAYSYDLSKPRRNRPIRALGLLGRLR
ncbi:LOW QUALITY PROTEIN: NAD-dependent protein deacetylase sirtuin-2 [Salvelinus alpinus]